MPGRYIAYNGGYRWVIQFARQTSTLLCAKVTPQQINNPLYYAKIHKY